jgi:hypothetical protein
MWAKTELDPERRVGVGIPAHTKWQIHVLAHVELRYGRSEAVTDDDGNAAVALLERERAGRQIRRGVAIELHAQRTAPRQPELRPDRKPDCRALQRQIPAAHAIQSDGGTDVIVNGCPAQHLLVEAETRTEGVPFGKLRRPGDVQAHASSEACAA